MMRISRKRMLRGLLCCAVAAALQGPALAAEGFGAPLPPAQNETVLSSMYIAMPDGTRLAADIYRPSRNGVALPGRFPVVLHHTAARNRLATDGDRSGAGRFSLQMINLASHGYVYVQVERRGIAASFGVRRGYHDRTEAQDAYDLTQWAASQSWSDGKVGVYGCSNTGDAAMHFLTKPAPALKAVFAGCFNWDKYSGGMRGGILANWGTGPQGSYERDMQSTPVDGDADRGLLRQAALGHAANTDLLALWSGMPHRDDVSPLTGTAFWEEGSIGTYVQKVQASKVPVYIQGGWNDDFRAQAFITLANLTQPAKLVIGPWSHCESGEFPMAAEALRYFDYWLKGSRNGIMDEPPIRYYTINAPASDAWRGAASWPLPQARPLVRYLGKAAGGANAPRFGPFIGESRMPGGPAEEMDGAVAAGKGASRLSLGAAAPVAGSANASFSVDYKVSCAQGTGLGHTCPQDDKGLVFDSAPLAVDMEVTGHPLADLWITSTAADSPLFAYLEDVDPQGGIAMVSEGRLRASLRALDPAPYKLPGLPWHGFYKAGAQPLKAGEAARMVFDLLPVSYVFKAGHRYRLTITGADPREKLRREMSPAPVLSVLFDAAHPSHIILPVVGVTDSGKEY
ncbi:MAG: CocE/NonD family hydrolase [Pseudomonadota bacterium]